MMADVEKVKRVKKGLACCSTDAYKCDDCPYIQRQMFSNNCTGYMKICADAMSVIDELQAEIERLKERVPKKGEWLQTDKPDITAALHPNCSVCGKEVTNHYAFCPFCGTDMRDSYEYIRNMT